MIRAASPEECEALSELALRSKAYWGYDAAFMAACVAELTIHPSDLARYRTRVLQAQSERVGFYRTNAIDEHTAELDMLFVDPKHMGSGHGSALVRDALAWARGEGYQWMQVTADPDAVPFYQHMGAKIYSEAPSGSIPGRTLPVLRFKLNQTK